MKKCPIPNVRISYSKEEMTPEEERNIIARALIILFQLDTKIELLK